MPAERYFVDQTLEMGEEVLLEESEFHHLTHVMRTREGDCVELINGKGYLAKSTVLRITKRQAVLTIDSLLFEEPSQMSYMLLQAIPRINRLDTIVEKCTELGASEICLWPAEHSERKDISKNQMERLQSLAISAMKQCGRMYLPLITLRPPLFAWEELPEEIFFGDVNPKAPLFMDIWKKKKRPNAAFVIGPESGFSLKELQWMNAKRFIGVKLHKHILRTDTAAIVALSLMSHSSVD